MDVLNRALGWAEAHRAELLDLVRVYLGLGLVARGVLFVAEPEAFFALAGRASQAWLTSGVLVHAVALAHLGGGVLLALGMLTRGAAAVQVPILAGAVFLVHAGEGLGAPGQSLELSALVLFLLLVFVVGGGGPWSLDAVTRREAARPEPAGAPAGAAGPVPAPTALAATPPAGPAAAGGPLPTCACGHDRGHPRVEPAVVYSRLGMMPFILGVTGPPRRVEFRCLDCGEVFEVTTEQAVLDGFRYYPATPPPDEVLHPAARP